MQILKKKISKKITLFYDTIIIDSGLKKEFAKIVFKKSFEVKIIYLFSFKNNLNYIVDNSQNVIKLTERFSLSKIRKVLYYLYEKKQVQL